MQPITNDVLLEDRYDSVFRANKVEPNEDVYDHRKNKHKKDYKFYNKVGTKAKELFTDNMAKKRKNDEAQMGIKGQLDSDVIII